MTKYAVVKQAEQFKFTKFHDSLEEARTEAMRLANLEEKRFFVLEMVGYADKKPMPIEWVETK